MLDDALVLLWILKFENILDQIVSIWIFDKIFDVFNDVVGELELLISGTFLEAPLHNTASMFVLANLDTIVHTSIENELGVLRGEIAAG